MRNSYDQSVDDRWKKKRYNYPDNNTIDVNASRIKNDDTLARHVEAFNNSKILDSPVRDPPKK